MTILFGSMGWELRAPVKQKMGTQLSNDHFLIMVPTHKNDSVYCTLRARFPWDFAISWEL